VFSAFLPQAGLAFGGPTSGYGHTPYDTWAAAAAQAEPIGQVAEIAFLVATEVGRALPGLRVTPEPEHRAVIVGSHTQVAQMGGAALIDLGMALAWEGFDVDIIPYGQEIGPADLEDVSLVVALPVIDYAGEDGGRRRMGACGGRRAGRLRGARRAAGGDQQRPASGVRPGAGGQ